MKTLRSETIVLFVQCRADPRLLEALRKTENCGGLDERMDEMHLSVFHSVSNRTHRKRSRNSISSVAIRFELVFVFLPRALVKKTVRYSRYII